MTQPAAADRPLDYQTPPKPSLGDHTARGFVWMIGQSLATKVVGFAGQIVLAWLLVPAEFGLVSLAFTVNFFTGVFRLASVREVLVQRQRAFDVWANPIFWISLWAGLGAALLNVAVAYPAEWVFGEKGLATLILCLAPLALLDALQTVPTARLQQQLRFRYYSATQGLAQIAIVALSILLAWLDFGAYAMILPRPLVSGLLAAVYWSAAPATVRRSWQVRRWPYVLRDTGRLLVGDWFVMMTYHGDRVVLGLFAAASAVGLYFFAYNLSNQTTYLVAINMMGVLFPAFSKLQDDTGRQASAFFRASRALVVIGLPMCLLQAALADPLVRLVFPAIWYDAIPMLQILSLGMAIAITTRGADSLIKSRGRFDVYLKLSIVYGSVFMIAAAIGAWLGGPTGMAVGVAAALAVNGFLQVYVALRLLGRGAAELLGIFLRPLIASTLAIGLAMLAGSLITGDSPLALLAKVGLVLTVSGLLYLPLARLLMPDTFNDLLARVVRRRAATTPA